MGLRYADERDVDQAGRIVLEMRVAENDDVRRRWTQHTLDGRAYRLRVRWLPLAATWIIDVMDDEGVVLLQGLPVRPGQSLMRPHVGERLPGRGFGQIFAVDTSKRGLDPTRDDFGTRVQLVYIPAVVT